MNNDKILIIISLALFLIPSFFWFNGLYFVGGDDSMLYYLYPKELVQYALNNFSLFDPLYGLTGIYTVPFFSLIYLVKAIFPFLNSELIFFGLSLSTSFLAFYLCLGLFIDGRNGYNITIKYLSSFIYTTSTFFINTLWTGFYSMYIATVFPLVFYFFAKGVRENNILYISLGSILLALFPFILLSTPWLLLAMTTVIPLVVILFYNNKSRFLLYLLLFICITVSLNAYWLLDFVEGLLHPRQTNLISTFSKTNELTGAITLIKIVTVNNNLLYPFLNSFFPQLSYSGFKRYLPFQTVIMYLNLILLYVIFVPLFFFQKLKKSEKKIYLGALLGWIVILYFYTVNIIGTAGLSLFVFLIEHVPGFIMFRNNYGKVAPAFPFIYSLLLGISLSYVFKMYKQEVFKKITLFTLITISLANAVPFLQGKYFETTLWSAPSITTTITDFNSDFYDLLNYLKLHNIDNPLWFPIDTANYVFIEDKTQKNHYYIGISPVQAFSGAKDIRGFMDLPPGTSIDFSNNILSGNFKEIGKALQKINIRYIIVNNDVTTSELKRSHFYSLYQRGDLFEKQKEFIQKNILGKEVARFGNRYLLYEIRNEYKSNVLISQKSRQKKYNNLIVGGIISLVALLSIVCYFFIKQKLFLRNSS